MTPVATASASDKSFLAPITPPSESTPSIIMSTAQTVLRAQAQALDYIAGLYDKDPFTQAQFFLSLQYMHNSILSNGKIVISGMGKSFKIAEKLVATMNSLGIHATSLHPSDALHGDLGVIKATDVVILITASGNTPELLALLPHIPTGIPILCLTNAPASPLATHASATLSAAIPKSLSEKVVYGLPAPTTSTTACLAVGDAVCITLAEMLVADVKERSSNFSRWHPGGAIGKDYKKEKKRGSSTEDDKTGTGVSTDDSELAAERRLHLIQRRITPWAKVAQIDTKKDGTAVSSELGLLRKCAGSSWLIVDSRYLVSTASVFAALEKTGFDETFFTEAAGAPTSSLEKHDLFLVHKHRETQLDTFDVSSFDIALMLDADGSYCGVYHHATA